LLLILLGLASLIGQDIKEQILTQATTLAPEVSGVLPMILDNLQQRVELGSVSGLVGLVFLLFLASFVFLQLRYSLDLIHGHHDPHRSRTFFEVLKERLWLMVVVVAMCVIFAASLFINPLVEILFASKFESKFAHESLQLGLNFFLLFILFTGLHFFTPTVKKRLLDCSKIAVITSAAFLLGNMLVGLYMNKIALGSLYGAAGALLIFLLWAFYSALMLFVSVEIFEFFRLRKKNGAA
jgi:membrane protein